MIVTFKCKETQKIWGGFFSKRLPTDIQQVARRKLRMLNHAKILTDLKIPPNNHLEALTDERKGQYSIRINKQWRICFKFRDGHVHDIEIIDYH